MPSQLRRAMCLGLPVGGLAGFEAWGAARVPGGAARVAPGHRRRLTLVASVLPPYVVDAGHAVGEGADIDLAREALAVAGAYELEVLLVPWRRALLLLETGEADFTTSVRITPEREHFLAFTQHYGEPVRYDFYTRRDSGLRIARLADLAGRSMALVAGAEIASHVRQAITGPVELAVDLQAAMRMVAAGRAEIVLADAMPAMWFAQRQGFGGQLRRQALTVDTGVQTQMGFSKRRAGYQTALAAMNLGLSQLARAGRWPAIQARYVSR